MRDWFTRGVPSSYAYRGERQRRRVRRQRLLTLGGLLVGGVALVRTAGPGEAAAAVSDGVDLATPVTIGPLATRAVRLAAPRVAPARGTRATLGRWNRVYGYALRYRIAPDLAEAIHDAAVAERVDPELAFRLVRAESEFNERARSRVGAVGLTQMMPATAREMAAGVTTDGLYERELNLRLGFRYLRVLVREYKSVRLALLVYNRGPVAVQAALANGDDPANGYDHAVLGSYRGRALLD